VLRSSFKFNINKHEYEDRRSLGFNWLSETSLSNLINHWSNFGSLESKLYCQWKTKYSAGFQNLTSLVPYCFVQNPLYYQYKIGWLLSVFFCFVILKLNFQYLIKIIQTNVAYSYLCVFLSDVSLMPKCVVYNRLCMFHTC
jgi:hypothetical protein